MCKVGGLVLMGRVVSSDAFLYSGLVLRHLHMSDWSLSQSSTFKVRLKKAVSGSLWNVPRPNPEDK